MKYKFPLATSSWDSKEEKAMQKVIKSGFFSMGESVKKFEINFAKYMGSKYCVMVNSGSSAILIMVASLFYTKNPKLKLKRGDEVIVPAVSWSTTYFPLYQYGLKIKFVDIDLETLNYNLEALNTAVTKKTRAIVTVNLLGNPNDFDRIKKIIGKKNILLIEDNCESMGAKYHKKYTGTFGLLGGYSTFFSHHISTMEGGLVVTDEKELYEIILCLRAHGWTRNLPKNNLIVGEKGSNDFKESFRFVLPGYNLRPIEMEGAIGIEQLKKLPMIVKERRKNAKHFQGILKNNKHFLIQKEIDQSSWFGFSLIIRPESDLSRDKIIETLTKIGFECRPIVAGNFTNNDVINFFDYEIYGDVKNAKFIDKNGFFIGNHHYPMTKAFAELKKFIASLD
jgi:CDP-6-deoxy-D-xylo-4-hexulose-3-dehydrase